MARYIKLPDKMTENVDGQTAAAVRWPAESDEAFPEIFTVMPEQPVQKKPGQLNQQQIRQFFEEVLGIRENPKGVGLFVMQEETRRAVSSTTLRLLC